jgi:hypothetical protein
MCLLRKKLHLQLAINADRVHRVIEKGWGPKESK